MEYIKRNWKSILIIIVAIAVIVGVGYYFARDFGLIKTNTSNNGDVTGYQPVYKEVDGKQIEVPMPNLDINWDSYNDQYIVPQAKELADKLKFNNKSYMDWIQMGLYFAGLNEYNKAESAWLYAGDIFPDHPLWAINLADLYAFRIHNNDKAKATIQQAITIDPTYIYSYFKAVEIYRDVLNDINGALDVVNAGLKANSGDVDLTALRTELLQAKKK